jgi:hypothetical protein
MEDYKNVVTGVVGSANADLDTHARLELESELRIDRLLAERPGALTYLAHETDRKRPVVLRVRDRKTLEANLAKTKHPFYRALLDYRAIKKVLSTYVEGTERRLDADDRLHPHFTFKPSTQRLSCTAPNIQNVVADREKVDGKPGLASGYRTCVVARAEEPEPTQEYLQRWQ